LGLTLLLLALPLTIHADEGLVAHYTFDEGSGALVKDQSGKGHDGKIKGAKYVKSPRGHALSFDGKDDMVDFGNSTSMMVEGSMTLMVWLKTDASVAPKTHRVILGDGSGTINRNLNLRIDHQNYLRFEWGDTKSHGTLATTSKMLDGSWRHLSVVCDWKSKLITFYVDAQPFAQGEMPHPHEQDGLQQAPHRLLGLRLLPGRNRRHSPLQPRPARGGDRAHLPGRGGQGACREAGGVDPHLRGRPTARGGHRASD